MEQRSVDLCPDILRNQILGRTLSTGCWRGRGRASIFHTSETRGRGTVHPWVHPYGYSPTPDLRLFPPLHF